MYFFYFKLQNMLGSSLNFKKSQPSSEWILWIDNVESISADLDKIHTVLFRTNTYEYTFHMHYFFHIIISLFLQFPSVAVFRFLVTQVDNLGATIFEYFRLEKFSHEASKYFFWFTMREPIWKYKKYEKYLSSNPFAPL